MCNNFVYDTFKDWIAVSADNCTLDFNNNKVSNILCDSMKISSKSGLADFLFLVGCLSAMQQNNYFLIDDFSLEKPDSVDTMFDKIHNVMLKYHMDVIDNVVRHIGINGTEVLYELYDH